MGSAGQVLLKRPEKQHCSQTAERSLLPAQFNAWAFARTELSRFSGIEGELFRTSRPTALESAPTLLQAGQSLAISLGSGMFMGGLGKLHCSDRRTCQTDSTDDTNSIADDLAPCHSGRAPVFSYRFRVAPCCFVTGPATAADVLKELTSACQKEVARNSILSTLLDVVSGLARDVTSVQELEQIIDMQPNDLTDADGLLPVAVTKSQLKQLAQYLHTGHGFPDLSEARELTLSPDPTEELAARNIKEAVRRAWTKGITFFEGLETWDPQADTGELRDLAADLTCPLYVAKWSQPFC